MSEQKPAEHLRFVSTTGKTEVIGLRTGGVMAITTDPAGTPTPPVFQAPAIQKGCVPVVMAAQHIAAQEMTGKVEATKDQLIAKAIRDMVAEGATSAATAERLFTKDGRPDANMLSARVGFNVTSSMRDDAWETFNKAASSNTGDDESNPNEE